jgi:hypothetical protein
MTIDRTRRRVLATVWLCALPLAAVGEPLLDELALAVENDRVDEVKKLLARGMDADSVGANGEPMLCIAARTATHRRRRRCSRRRRTRTCRTRMAIRR